MTVVVILLVGALVAWAVSPPGHRARRKVRTAFRHFLQALAPIAVLAVVGFLVVVYLRGH